MTDQKRCSNPECSNPAQDENGLLGLDEFSPDKRARDGKQSRCRYCYNLARYPNFLKNQAEKEFRQNAFERGLKPCANPDCQHPYRDENGLLPLDQFYEGQHNTVDGRKSRCICCSSENIEVFLKNLKHAEAQAVGKLYCVNPECDNPNKDENRFLDHSEFYEDRRTQSGYVARCKSCYAEYQKSPRIQEKRKAWSQSKAGKVSQAKYYRSPKGKSALRRNKRTSKGKASEARYWRSKKGQRTRERHYRTEKYKITRRRATHKRRTALTNVGGSYTRAEWKALCRFYDFRCLCCGQKFQFLELTADHIVPVSCGGTSNISNIQPLCGTCNRSKGTKTVDYRHKKVWWEQLSLF